MIDVDQYLETALWSSTHGEEGREMDSDFDLGDISPEAREQAKQDCKLFAERAAKQIDQLQRSYGGGTGGLDKQLAHDFWLTRNSHGVGFWDRDLGSIGIKLTDIAKGFGEINLYEGDDGLLYFL